METENEKQAIDIRYPKPNKEIRALLIGYPIAVGASFVLRIGLEAWWWLLAFCGIGWTATALTAVINVFRREAYHSAQRDIELKRIAESSEEPLIERSSLGQ